MQPKAVAIVCILLAAPVFAVWDVRGVPHRALMQSSSSSEGNPGPQAINPAEQSSSSGHPVRRAALVAEVQNAFVASVAESIATIESGGDAFAVAEIGADAYAMAIAQALATFIAELDSNPADPTPCVQAEADTQTNAEVFARILVEILAQSSNDIEFVSAVEAFSAIVAVTVSEYASALSAACESGDFSADTYVDVLQTALAIPFAEVITLAYALVMPSVIAAPIVVTETNGALVVATVDGRMAFNLQPGINPPPVTGA